MTNLLRSTIRVPSLTIRNDETGISRLNVELLLLLIAASFVVVNLTALTLLRSDRWTVYWGAGGAWLLCTVAGSVGLRRFLPKRDPFIFPLVMFLSGWGLVAIARSAPNFAQRQSVWLIVAAGALLAVVAVPRVLDRLREYRYLWLLLGLGLLTGTIILGSNPSGIEGAPQLWLGFDNIVFQPSEVLKVVLIAFLASYLAEQQPLLRAGALSSGLGQAVSPRIAGPVLLMFGLSVVLLTWQRDLGAALLFFIVFLVLFYIATGSYLVLVGGTGLIVLVGALAYTMFGVVRLRIDIWLNPWADASGDSFQIVQSLQAFAAGGIFGQGVGQGSPTFIPVVHSDFVFSAIAEEWGLVGVIVVVGVLAVIASRGFQIAIIQQGSPFRMLMASGLTTLLVVQSIMIMGGVLRVLPLTGVTLPFISYGGSSLVMSFVTVGLLLRLSANMRDSALDG